MLKVLFVGDVIGQGGRKVLKERLPEVQSRYRIDFTIVNVENAAAGFGITPKLTEEILSWGADVLTSGNHIWDRKEILEYFPRESRLLRPGNYPAGVPGSYHYVGETRSGVRVAVINLQGRVFMPLTDCPFQTAEREIPKLARQTPVVVVDFHAEATSEKMAMGWFLDGRVSAVIGTHTHVPTADARVLPRGTAYITDAGMTGCYDSIIGMSVESSLSRFLTGLPTRFEAATGPARFSAVLVDIDEHSGQSRAIQRVELT